MALFSRLQRFSSLIPVFYSRVALRCVLLPAGKTSFASRPGHPILVVFAQPIMPLISGIRCPKKDSKLLYS
jgi:hypothetical protein